MATAELDSFVVKLKCLMHAGHEASLNATFKDGKLCIDLKAEIALNSLPDGSPQAPWRQIRSPSYKRRQERRRAGNVAEQANGPLEEKNAAVKQATAKTISTADGSETVSEKVVRGKLLTEMVGDKADESFLCENCSFRSKWINGLKVHMGIKHRKPQQIDDLINGKYENTEHYWKNGWLGSTYQTFLDANDIIEEVDFSPEDNEAEKNKVLDARKAAFGPGNWRNFPPWSK